MKVETVDICTCGIVMHQRNPDDYDTGGSDSGRCCPDCGNETFQTIKQLQAEISYQQAKINARDSHLRERCKKVHQLKAELERESIEHLKIQQLTETAFKEKIGQLQSFVQFVLSSIKETHNAGHVFINSMENLKRKAQALSGIE